MSIQQIFLYVLTIFIGYSIGRWSHIIGGHFRSPHHWIYGLLLVLVGLFFWKKWWGGYIAAFGLGLFVSDWNDFLALRFYGVDVVKIKKFWGFD